MKRIQNQTHAPASPAPGAAEVEFPPNFHSNSPAIPQIPHFPPLSTFVPVRHRDPLGQITIEQRARLHRWLFVDELKLEEICLLISKPAPEGFAITTSKPALSRYRKKHNLLHQLDDNAELKNILADPKHSFADLLQQIALFAVADAEFDAKTFNSLNRFYRSQIEAQHYLDSKTQRDRHLDLIADRLRLETLKIQINAARQALEHAPIKVRQSSIINRQ